MIKENVASILSSLPQGILLVAASKTRTPDEVAQAIEAGISVLGYNYVQEAEQMHRVIGNEVRWHLIGHLQSNKAKKAVHLFDMIETIDSWKIAQTVNRHCSEAGKIMPILVEINSGKESNKTGILPEDVDEFVRKLSDLPNLRVQGLMTMGLRFGNPEDARPYFKATKAAFDRLSEARIPNVEMK